MFTKWSLFISRLKFFGRLFSALIQKVKTVNHRMKLTKALGVHARYTRGLLTSEYVQVLCQGHFGLFSVLVQSSLKLHLVEPISCSCYALWDASYNCLFEVFFLFKDHLCVLLADNKGSWASHLREFTKYFVDSGSHIIYSTFTYRNRMRFYFAYMYIYIF